MMQLSSLGRAFIKSTERLSLVAYPDGKTSDGRQLYSIGYGHSGAQKGQRITASEAERLFDADVQKYTAAVNGAISHASQQQFDALVSFAYNVGAAGFAGSSVARLHQQGNYLAAADALRLWNKSEGQVHEGLIDRRERERHLYLYGEVSLPGGVRLVSSPEGVPALAVAAAVALAAYFALPRWAPTRRVLASS